VVGRDADHGKVLCVASGLRMYMLTASGLPIRYSMEAAGLRIHSEEAKYYGIRNEKQLWIS